MPQRRYAVTTFTERLHDSLAYMMGSSTQMDYSRYNSILVNTSRRNIKKIVCFFQLKVL